MPIAHVDLFSNALFALFTLSAERYIPLTSPRNKGERLKRWKSERMQRLYKEQKANNAVHLPLYLNVLRFFLYNYWIPLDISFWGSYTAYLYRLLPIGSISWYKLSSGYAAQLSPWKRGEREGITYTETDV